MNVFALLIAVWLLPQESFAEFSFCREGVRPDEPVYCIRLNADAAGAFTIMESDGRDFGSDDVVEESLSLSAAGSAEFFRMLEDTDYLLEADEYESERSVANLGRKILSIDGEWGTRLATFNYSGRSEVNRLVTFLDGLVSQQLMLLDLDVALRFDRLGLPSVIERLAEDLRQDRFPDPAGFIEMLRLVSEDGRVVNYTRATAERLIEDIEGR